MARVSRINDTKALFGHNNFANDYLTAAEDNDFMIDYLKNKAENILSPLRILGGHCIAELALPLCMDEQIEIKNILNSEQNESFETIKERQKKA